MNQETLVFGGRLWFVDLTWGVVSADPFRDRPELSFAELPRGSVLPEGAQDIEGVPWSQKPDRYRRVGVSEGRLRYVEVSRMEPFILSSFVLDKEGSSWTLENRVALSKLWADGGYPWLPIKEGMTPQIGLLDPLNASVVYLTVDEHIIVLDMNLKEVIGPCLYTGTSDSIPCVLPPWLGSSRIPSAGTDLLVQLLDCMLLDFCFSLRCMCSFVSRALSVILVSVPLWLHLLIIMCK
jgi:hypothetical protein